MKHLILFLMALVLILFEACGKRTQNAEPQVEKRAVEEVRAEEMGTLPVEAPQPSIILGRIASLWLDESKGESTTRACQEHPCEAKVEILTVEQKGSGYSGYFEAGTILEAHFIFTLVPTETVLPELNTPLPGLKEGDYFRAEVNYREHGPLQIGTYERIEQ